MHCSPAARGRHRRAGQRPWSHHPPWSSTEPAKAPPPRRPGGAHNHTNNQTPAGQHTTTTNTRRRPQASSSASSAKRGGATRKQKQGSAIGVQSAETRLETVATLAQHLHNTSLRSQCRGPQCSGVLVSALRAQYSVHSLCHVYPVARAPPRPVETRPPVLRLPQQLLEPAPRPVVVVPHVRLLAGRAAAPGAVQQDGHRVRHADRDLRLGPLRRQQLRRRGRDVGETVAASHVERERADCRCLELRPELVDAAVVDPRVPAVRIRSG
jgi:hypothetical protein